MKLLQSTSIVWLLVNHGYTGGTLHMADEQTLFLYRKLLYVHLRISVFSHQFVSSLWHRRSHQAQQSTAWIWWLSLEFDFPRSPAESRCKQESERSHNDSGMMQVKKMTDRPLKCRVQQTVQKWRIGTTWYNWIILIMMKLNGHGEQQAAKSRVSCEYICVRQVTRSMKSCGSRSR